MNQKKFFNMSISTTARKSSPPGWAEPRLRLLALQQHLSADREAITTQGPRGWPLSCSANKVLFTCISSSEGTRTWFACGQIPKQIWKYIFKLSVKTNIWQLGQNPYTEGRLLSAFLPAVQRSNPARDAFTGGSR